MSIRVNVSEQEDKAGAREPLPAGKFHVAVTDVQLVESQSDDNLGKPMLAFEFTVQDTPGSWQEFHGRKDFTNACLWDGALYTIIMVLKAMGRYDDLKDANGELDIPTEPEFYLGEELIIRRATDPKQKKRWPDMPERWIQVRGILPYEESTAHQGAGEKVAAGAGSMLP
jgi:hypothetical protein